MSATTLPDEHTIPHKWRTLLLLSFAELLAMVVWFSASAVVPALTDAWGLDDSGKAWLTMSVQIGFVVGALGSAILTLADRIPAHRFFTVSTVLAGTLTLLIPVLARGLTVALILRFLTGLVLAGVYPVGMKIMTTWTRKDRGLSIGLLVGALSIGSATPHLLNVFGGVGEWQTVMVLAAACAYAGALIGLLFIKEGPYKTKSPRFNWRDAGKIIRDRDVMLANLGYLGHMWELYAMWSWIPSFLLASFALRGVSAEWASLVAFLVIAVGGVGSLLSGKFADTLGRTTMTTLSLVTSGICAVCIGFFYGGNPVILSVVAMIWGFAIVADSAQFSACVSELTQPEYVGTALTLQTSMGFLLTLVTIRMVPPIQETVGWEWAFVFLALGPAMGIWAMLTLRRSDAAIKLANGNR